LLDDSTWLAEATALDFWLADPDQARTDTALKVRASSVGTARSASVTTPQRAGHRAALAIAAVSEDRDPNEHYRNMAGGDLLGPRH